MWASAYLPLGISDGNDAQVSKNGDIVGYWTPDKVDPADWMDAVGVAVRNASKHLAPVLSALPG